MTGVTLYHNPRCSKSRQTLALLEENGIEFNTIEYLNTPLTADEIIEVTGLLGVSVRDIIRTGEDEYREMGLSDESKSDEELIEAIIEAPILLQRPIVVSGDQARIGRPPEVILEIL